MPDTTIRCPYCGSNRITLSENNLYGTCSACSSHFEVHSSQQKQVIENVIVDPRVRTLTDRLSTVRGLITTEQYDAALSELDSLSKEHAENAEVWYLLAQARSHGFVANLDGDTDKFLSFADKLSGSDGSVQAKTALARQRIAMARSAQPLIAELESEKMKLRSIRASLDQVSLESGSVRESKNASETAYSASKAQLAALKRQLTGSRVRRLILLLLAVCFAAVAILAAWRCFPGFRTALRTRAGGVYRFISEVVRDYDTIPFVASTPAPVSELIEKIPLPDSVRYTGVFRKPADPIVFALASLAAVILFGRFAGKKKLRGLREAINDRQRQVRADKDALRTLSERIDELNKQSSEFTRKENEQKALISRLEENLKTVLPD